jgi:fibronectin-binding autotransporter adhesin
MRNRRNAVVMNALLAATLGVAGIAQAQWTGAGAGGAGTDFNTTTNWNGGTISGDFGNVTSSASITASANASPTGALAFFNSGTPSSSPLVFSIDGTGGVRTLTMSNAIAVRRGNSLGTLPTASWSAGDSTLTVSSTTGLLVGQTVTAGGIVPGTTIAGISGNVITLSYPAYANQGSAASLTIGNTAVLGSSLEIALGGSNRTFTAGSGSGVNASLNVASLISGTGGIDAASGYVNLTNSSNSFTGSIANPNGSGGTLNFTSAGALGAGTAMSVNNSTMAFTGTAAASVARNLTNANSGIFNNNSSGGSTSTLTLTGTVNTGNSGHNLTFGGTNKTALNEASGVISGAGNVTVGSGISGDFTGANWRFSNNANSFTGSTSVWGVLEFTSIASVGAGNSSLGAPTTASAGTITMGASAAGTLRYVGSGHTSDRQLLQADAGSPNGSTVIANGTGALVLTSGWRYDGTAQADKSRSLTFDGTNTNANTIGSIVFNYTSASAKGSATVTKNGTGLWVMNGTNAYNSAGAGTAGTYTTNVNNGVLRLGSTGAIPAASRLSINGGVLELGAADFTRDTSGTAADGNVQFASGGFSAFGGDRVVNFNNDGSTKTWGANGFLTGSSTLQLSSAYADSTVTVQNGIALNGTSRTIDVANGTAAVDAVLAGAITQTGTANLTKIGAGALTISGSYTGAGGQIIPNFGTLLISGKISGGVGVTSSVFGSGSSSAVLTLTNDTSDFTGAVASGAQGNINFTSIADAGSPSSLGAATGSNATIAINNSTVTFIGTAAQSSNRAFAATNTGQIIANGTTASATLSLSGGATIANNSTLWLRGSNTGTNVFSGAISGSSTASVQKRDAGVWRLTNASSSFGGTLSGDGGRLEFTSVANSGFNSSLGSGSTIGVNNMSLSFVGSTAQSTNRTVLLDNSPFLLANGTTTGATITYSGTVQNNAASARTLVLGGSNTGLNSISGTLSNGSGGALSVVKQDAGTWVLGGTGSYTGSTTVTAGSLLINGTIAGGVAVNAGTLQGNGNGTTSGLIGGSVTIGNTATGPIARDSFLAPGNSVGSLKVNGGVSFLADGQLEIEIDDSGPTVIDATSDLLTVGGNLNISSAALNFTVTGSLNDNAIVFAKYGTLTGTFSPTAVSGLPSGYQIDYNYNGLNQIALTVIPEPGVAFTFGALASSLLLKRRKPL